MLRATITSMEEPPTCRIVTEDAIGEKRHYVVTLRDEYPDRDGRLMAGKRVDDHDRNHPKVPDGPTQQVWNAAREEFEQAGLKVIDL